MAKPQAAQAASRFDKLDKLSLFLFCASVPLLLPVFEAWQRMTPAPAVGALSFLPAIPFVSALALSAMFTALAFLFVCLLKTAHARVSRAIFLVALCCYGTGYVLLDLWGFGVLDGSIAAPVCGLALGFGGAVVCLVWMGCLRELEFRSALRTVWVAACCLFASAVVLPLLGDGAARAALTAAALLSLAGCTRRFFSREREDAHALAVQAGVNWWDVFGHLDVSVVEGTGDFKTPLARTLFFVVMPLATLLLFAADSGLVTGADWPLGPLALGGLVAVAAMAPLMRFKSDQALINFFYRFFLPLIAFAAFASAVIVDEPYQRTVMVVGALAFCVAYALVMSAMLVTMAGRMRSLALPAGGIMIIVSCLVCLLANSGAEPDMLGGYRYHVLLVLFVALAVVLMVTPSSRLWRVVLKGIDAAESNAFDMRAAYGSRCAKLADKHGLTAREAEILVMLARGHTSNFVADELTVAESTVRSHRKNIYRKLGVSSREELFKLLDARDEGDA